MSTKIEWTDTSWNPMHGCSSISAGCQNCYAKRMAKRQQAMGTKGYENGFKVTLRPDRLEQPLRWRKSRMVFVGSMSDLFHSDVPFEFVDKVFATMLMCRHHTFQLLTKRPERMAEYTQRIAAARHHDSVHQSVFDAAMAVYLEPKDATWPRPGIWLGTSVEEQAPMVMTRRIAHLRASPAAVRFVSCEPLLGPIDKLPLSHIDWVIVGGETGPGARPMQLEWVRSIRDQCQEAGVPFFFKGRGGVRKGPDNRLLDGCEHNAMPAAQGVVAT